MTPVLITYRVLFELSWAVTMQGHALLILYASNPAKLFFQVGVGCFGQAIDRSVSMSAHSVTKPVNSGDQRRRVWPHATCPARPTSRLDKAAGTLVGAMSHLTAEAAHDVPLAAASYTRECKGEAA